MCLNSVGAHQPEVSLAPSPLPDLSSLNISNTSSAGEPGNLLYQYLPGVLPGLALQKGFSKFAGF